ncbi:MAG TPA: XrtA/PEP-CTERM system-associated ATPase [Nitrospirota bacterium]|nr:XrtA/PEP-CTERM system-associated ATPase [Nitrospirota bacterium]
MYEAFFNLKTKPFELVPNPDFLYMSRSHKRAMYYLYYGVKERAGFILLSGEVGSGKTTLISDLINRIDANINLSRVFNTKVNSHQLIAMINTDFGLDVKGKDKVDMLNELNDYLIEQHARGNNSVLIIDEAQNLKPDLLEEIRMLSNLETDTAKLLQIILVGQPEIRDLLARPELRQLRQRISISCRINPLTRLETEEYILHRLEVAGNREAVIFSDGCMDVIFKYCKGIPRLVNIMCDYLLLTAFIEEKKTVDASMVRDIVEDLDFENLYWGSKQPEPEPKITINRSALLEALGLGEE